MNLNIKTKQAYEKKSKQKSKKCFSYHRQIKCQNQSLRGLIHDKDNLFSLRQMQCYKSILTIVPILLL